MSWSSPVELTTVTGREVNEVLRGHGLLELDAVREVEVADG